MKTISLNPLNRKVEVQTNQRVLDAMLAEQVDVMMLCKGRGLCATCHVFVEDGEGSLTPRTIREERTLSRITGACGNSRLACQARVVGEGVQVKLPQGMYVEQVSDLYSLLGKRAEQNILHPITGQVLIPEGKIILRMALDQLSDLQMDIDNLKTIDA
ncbi:MAG: (2Fe-2S)-binding protein [Deltaproteobacteria bacterium]|nr:MAG: (2Fe-2S)-binding protein [Deltaproteobacteria bacterium]